MNNKTSYPLWLHIGGGFSVRMSEVVGIFDMDNTTVEKCTRILLERAEKEKRIITATHELPKSFVITVKNGSEKVFLSQLSAATLMKRLSIMPQP